LVAIGENRGHDDEEGRQDARQLGEPTHRGGCLSRMRL
jgi:hypothetical protein